MSPQEGTGAPPAGPPASADPRLVPYLLVALAGLVGAVVTGEPALASVAAPFAALVVVGLADRRPPTVRAAVEGVPHRAIEGDRVELTVELRWHGVASHDAVLVGARPLTGDDRTWTVAEGRGAARLPLVLVAPAWGRHGLGHLHVRTRRPRGLLVWDVVVPLPGEVRVLPSASRLAALLHPSEPLAVAGGHPSPVRAPGTDFAELRPYRPGDRLRDLSWAASARSGSPWVVLQHPERTGTVLLLLDAFVEDGAPPGALDRAARVAWSLARHHLGAGDRVGLASVGAAPRWLAPATGRRAQWLVLDALLSVGSAAAGGAASLRLHDRGLHSGGATVPPDATVVGITPLQADAFVAALAHHRRQGRRTAAVVVETLDLLPGAPAPADPVESAARRLWRLEVDARRAALARAGIDSAVASDDPSPAVAVLARRSDRRRATGALR